MTNLEKCNAGIEYSYADEELIALKTEAIRQCEIFNAIDGRDYMAQYRHLQQMLGRVGERVWIAKTFNCDRGKNIFIGDDFTGNHNLTILDIREVYIGNHVMIGPNTLITTVGHPLSPQGISCLGQARAHRQRCLDWWQRYHPSRCDHRQQRGGSRRGCD